MSVPTDWGDFGRCVECEEHPALGPNGYCGACFFARYESHQTNARYELSAYIACDRDEAERLAEAILEESSVLAVGVRPVDETDPRYAEAVA